jgi:hypothetical protein
MVERMWAIGTLFIIEYVLGQQRGIEIPFGQKSIPCRFSGYKRQHGIQHLKHLCSMAKMERG